MGKRESVVRPDFARSRGCFAPLFRPVLILFPFIAISLLAIAATAGQPLWETKDWTKWSSDQCQQVLNESPWDSGAAEDDDPGSRLSESKGVFVQLRSALPVRLALARQEVLQSKYNKMNAEERKDFDAKIQSEIDQNFVGTISLHIVTFDSPKSYEHKAWPPVKAGCVLPDGTEILSSESASVTTKSGKTDYDVTLPRVVSGWQLVKRGDKPFYIDVWGYRAKFDPSKMMFHGKLEY